MKSCGCGTSSPATLQSEPTSSFCLSTEEGSTSRHLCSWLTFLFQIASISNKLPGIINKRRYSNLLYYQKYLHNYAGDRAYPFSHWSAEQWRTCLSRATNALIGHDVIVYRGFHWLCVSLVGDTESTADQSPVAHSSQSEFSLGWVMSVFFSRSCHFVIRLQNAGRRSSSFIILIFWDIVYRCIVITCICDFYHKKFLSFTC